MSVGALVLAAGASRRFGQQPKLLAELRGKPLLLHVLDALAPLDVPVTLVLGCNADQLRECLRGQAVTVIENPHWEQGMGSSLACGIQHLQQQGSTRVLISLADQPALNTAGFKRMLAASNGDPRRIAVSDAGQFIGPPCIFPQAYFAELLVLDGDHGARAVMRQHAESLLRVAWPESALDIDSREDLQRILRSANSD